MLIVQELPYGIQVTFNYPTNRANILDPTVSICDKLFDTSLFGINPVCTFLSDTVLIIYYGINAQINAQAFLPFKAFAELLIFYETGVGAPFMQSPKNCFIQDFVQVRAHGRDLSDEIVEIANGNRYNFIREISTMYHSRQIH